LDSRGNSTKRHRADAVELSGRPGSDVERSVTLSGVLIGPHLPRQRHRAALTVHQASALEHWISLCYGPQQVIACNHSLEVLQTVECRCPGQVRQ
jgi:hypothetical protein